MCTKELVSAWTRSNYGLVELIGELRGEAKRFSGTSIICKVLALTITVHMKRAIEVMQSPSLVACVKAGKKKIQVCERLRVLETTPIWRAIFDKPHQRVLKSSDNLSRDECGSSECAI